MAEAVFPVALRHSHPHELAQGIVTGAAGTPARTELEKGELVCIFPEGEITRTSHVKPFERGVDIIRRGLSPLP